MDCKGHTRVDDETVHPIDVIRSNGRKPSLEGVSSKGGSLRALCGADLLPCEGWHTWRCWGKKRTACILGREGVPFVLSLP